MCYVINFISKSERVFIFLAFVLMVFSSFIQVLNRNLFEFPVSGLEEVSKYCMVYIVMLGTEMGLRDGTQIRVTLLLDNISNKFKWILEIIVCLILITFSGIMLSESFGIFMQQISSGQTSPGLKLPMYIPYFSLLLGFVSIFLTQIYKCISSIFRYYKEEGRVVCQD